MIADPAARRWPLSFHDPMRPDLLKTALVLGLLSAIGPFAIDMYLPALPSIGKSLGTSVGAVQASLMAFFVALGLGQVLYGPVSDMVGRKAPLYFGLVLFGLGSIGCALAPTSRPWWPCVLSRAWVPAPRW